MLLIPAQRGSAGWFSVGSRTLDNIEGPGQLGVHRKIMSRKDTGLVIGLNAVRAPPTRNTLRRHVGLEHLDILECIKHIFLWFTFSSMLLIFDSIS